MNFATETELKLRVSPAAVRRLIVHPLLKGRAITKRLRTVYFDTPHFDLWQEGITLRVRHDGGRWVQTVKGGGTARGGLHQRVEIETEVPGPDPDCAAVTNEAFAQIFASPRVRAHLKPVFVTRFTRRTRMIEIGPAATVDASLDRGEIRCGDIAEPMSELELELKSGSPPDLFKLALQLLDTVPLRVEIRSKAERGYTLARGERPAAVKSIPAALDPVTTVGEAFKAIAGATLDHLLSNERGMLAGRDPEYLHQMRVALRRLRAALGVFSAVLPEATTAPLLTEVKWIAGALGPARDWDVFTTETLPPIREAFTEHAVLVQFARECDRQRSKAVRTARRAVASTRYQRLQLHLGGWLAGEVWLTQADDGARAALDNPAREFANAVLEQRYARVRKRGRKLQRLSAAELHRLRIAIKKLRYAADFFAGLYHGGRVRNMLKRLTRLQDILGAVNDAQTVENLMQHGFGAAPAAAVAEARGIMLGWSKGRAATLRRELRSAWKSFRASEKFW